MPAYNARRENGVCRGSLWKQHVASGSGAGNKFSNDRGKYHDYCVLIGNTLTSYPDRAAFKRGEFPTSEIRIVGASSWTPVSRVPNPFSQSGRSTSSATSPAAASAPGVGVPQANTTETLGVGSSIPGNNNSQHGNSGSTHGSSNASTTSNSPTFRIVTFAGTHVYCTAPSVHDRNVWLAALHSGLEASYTGLDNLELLSQIRKQQQQQKQSQQNGGDENDTYGGGRRTTKSSKSKCKSCGTHLSPSTTPTNDTEESTKYNNNNTDKETNEREDGKYDDSILEQRDSGTYEESSSQEENVEEEEDEEENPADDDDDDDDVDDESSDPWDVSDTANQLPDDKILKRQRSAERRSKRLSQALLDPNPIRKKQTSSGSASSGGTKKKGDGSSGVLGTTTGGTSTISTVLPANTTIFADSELFTPPRPHHLYETSNKYCKSCGAAPPPPNADHSVSLHQNAVPLPHYNAEMRVDYICNNCLIAQGVLGNIREWNGLYSGMMHERAALNTARSLCASAVEQVMRLNSTSVDTNGGSGSGDRNGMSGSGLSEASQSTGDSWENLAKGVGGENGSKFQGGGGESPLTPDRSNTGTNSKSPGGGNRTTNTTATTSSSWHCIRSTPEQVITSTLLQLLSSPGFATLRRRSKCLDVECQRLERIVVLGVHAVVEFLENLDTMCGIYPPVEEDAYDDEEVVLLGGGGGGDNDKSNTTYAEPLRRRLELKKEALKMSGDMTTAMKLLHDNALGISSVGSSGDTTATLLSDTGGNLSSSVTQSSNSIDMLTCLLELLLDLCEEGELAAVAFFWPQLRHIHLTMLPPINATQLCHVELVEDFLLTVACKYSVQLALELVWGCLADLEEGLGHTLASHWSMVPMEEEEGEVLPGDVGDKIRRRRWSVMRFLCELESLMFGFEGGWGGGKVCLRGTLTPSEHQSQLIREAVAMLQVYRLESPYYLSRSVRRDLLRAERAILRSREGGGDSGGDPDGSQQLCSHCAQTIQASGSFQGMIDFVPTVKLNTDMLMRNAHFLSSQLNFIRKLSEVAEKLRFLPVNRRGHALKSELKKINLYLTESNRRGRIGAGDPIATPTFDTDNDDIRRTSIIGGSNSGTGSGSGMSNASNHLTKVVHLPINEGHVFRSKARTPVLLVFEVMQPTPRIEAPKNISNISSDQSPSGAAQASEGSESKNEDEKEQDTNTGVVLLSSENAEQNKGDATVSPKNTKNESHGAAAVPQDTSFSSPRKDLNSASQDLSSSSTSISVGGEATAKAPPPQSPTLSRSLILQRLESPLIYTSSNNIISSSQHQRGMTEDTESGDLLNVPSLGGLPDLTRQQSTNSAGSSTMVKNRSRTNSHHGVGTSMEDMTELVQSAMQDNLALTEKTVKMPKLEEMGGATDPAAAAAARKYSSDNKGQQDLQDDADEPEEYTERSKAEKSPSAAPSTNTKPKKALSSSSPSTTKKAERTRRVVSVTQNVGRKMTALGGASQRAMASIHATNSRTLQGVGAGTSSSIGGASAQDFVPGVSSQSSSSSSPFGIFSQERREVLSTILATGMKGNPIAKGAAAAAQKSIQNIDRRNALGMIDSTAESDEYHAGGGGSAGASSSPSRGGGSRARETKGSSSSGGGGKSGGGGGSDDTSLTASQLSSGSTVGAKQKASSTSSKEEDECLESLRLILLQNRVAQGNLTPEGAARALVGPEGKKHGLFSHFKGKDAGEVDPRLAGCGHLSHALHSALKLWKEGTITNAELLELAHRDQQFIRQSLPGSENMTTLMEDSAFWVRFAFGERWAEKKSRISARSPYGRHNGWDLVSVIVKSNDDLRQEAFVMQLIQLCKEAFELAGLELWLLPYRIVSTGKSTGIIETLKNTLSFDAIKKKPGYTGLRGHFERMTEFATDPKSAFQLAQSNFVRSLAAYSLLSYLFQFKDRHNGNLMLDTEGHMVHIDFGFVFGIAPGGAFSLEANTPFKLTDEMVEVMGGLNSALFSEFVTLFSCGFLALQQHTETFCTLVEITCRDSPFPCFAGKDPSDVVDKLRARFCPNLDKGASVAYALDLIKQSLTSYGTRQYDFYQYMSQGIAT